MRPADLLEVAYSEARKGLAEGGIPIGAALFTPPGCCSAAAATDVFKTTIHRCTPKPMRSAPPVANATTVPR